MRGGTLKGLAKVKKTLGSREAIYYCYAWRGGPLLTNSDGRPLQPDDPALPQAFAAAHEQRRNPQTNDLAMLIRIYRGSTDFTRTAASTREAYIRHLDAIRSKFGMLSCEELDDKRTRAKFKDWRDSMADRPRTADYAWTTLRRVLSFAKDRGYLSNNICERGGRLHFGSRAAFVWQDDQIERFLRLAPAWLHLPLLLALWTGQRQGDLLALRWEAYDGLTIRFHQSKTRAYVAVPAPPRLKQALDATERVKPQVLLNSSGKAWTGDGFRTSWRKGCEAAELGGLTFHDLRGTAVTRMALAGCTAAEIGAVTGHSLRDVDRILDAHYLGGRQALAVSAIQKTIAQMPNAVP